MRNTLYRQMVYWINMYRTWIKVADDNLYKEHIISRSDRTDYVVSRTLVLRAFKANGQYAEGTTWEIPEHELDRALATHRKRRPLSDWRPTVLSARNSCYRPFPCVKNPTTYDVDCRTPRLCRTAFCAYSGIV